LPIAVPFAGVAAGGLCDEAAGRPGVIVTARSSRPITLTPDAYDAHLGVDLAEAG
jgi:hypothetical protein